MLWEEVISRAVSLMSLSHREGFVEIRERRQKGTQGGYIVYVGESEKDLLTSVIKRKFVFIGSIKSPLKSISHHSSGSGFAR